MVKGAGDEAGLAGQVMGSLPVRPVGQQEGPRRPTERTLDGMPAMSRRAFDAASELMIGLFRAGFKRL